jgi:inner membrane protein involved in colicin E2 resistance
MQSAWPDPSFTGTQLPDTSSVSKNGLQQMEKSFPHKKFSAGMER